MVNKKSVNSKKRTSAKSGVKKKSSAVKKVNKTVKKSFPIGMVVSGVALLLILVAGFIFFGSEKDFNKITGDVVLDMYVMSQCPYGAIAENEAIKAVQKFGDEVTFNIHYIVSSQGDIFSSLHGPPEVAENMRQLCVENLYPRSFYDYLLCFNENYVAGENQFNLCAKKLDLDSEKIVDCVNKKGVELLKASEEKTKEVGATGSPTIYLNGESYSSGRSELDFSRAICNFLDYEHDGCLNITRPVEVSVRVVNDPACTTCNPSNVISTIKQLFPGAVVETVDVNSEDGKKLVQDYGLVYLPSYIFDSDILETNTWSTNQQIRASFVEAGDGYRIRDEAVGATYFIDDDKRKEQEDFINNYPQRNLEVLGYDSDKPRLDYFVMAFCPYGNPADEAASIIYELLGDSVEIVPHYIIAPSGDKVSSLHGEQEGNQGVRELCVLELEGMKKFFDFTLEINNKCSYTNADTCWVSVAESLGLDVEAIKSCESDRKIVIATAQDNTISQLATLRNGQLVNPRASPTFLINGETHLGGRDANSIKNVLCQHFTADNMPSECGEVVMVETSAPVGNC